MADMGSSVITDHHFTFGEGGKTHYIAAGPEAGPLLIFVHGWIAVAVTWTPQLEAFAALGFRVVAPDTRGYGGSTTTSNHEDYKLEQHVIDLLALLSHLNREQAIWIGHDWGSGIVWALTAHHPQVVTAAINLAVPYRGLELGLDALISTVNREIYPLEAYPSGQWDYQIFHTENPDRAAAILDKDPENTIKALYTPVGSETYKKPSWTSQIRKVGGWFGPLDSAPEKDIETTLLKGRETIYAKLVETVRKNGTRGPNSYYRNHDANKAYAETSVNGGKLDMPVLFIGGKWDWVCDPGAPRFCIAMRQFCSNLTECTIEAGHWIALEKPEETNAVIARWLATKVPRDWPGYWSSPFVSN